MEKLNEILKRNSFIKINSKNESDFPSVRVNQRTNFDLKLWREMNDYEWCFQNFMAFLCAVSITFGCPNISSHSRIYY